MAKIVCKKKKQNQGKKSLNSGKDTNYQTDSRRNRKFK